MRTINIRLSCVKVGIVLLCAVLIACGGSPAPVSAQPVPTPDTVSPPDELDAAVRETSDYLNNQLSKGNKLVILNVQSEFPALSEYIIDELIANTVNDRIFYVVDRQQLNTIRTELNFQMSGEVSDESAQNIGQMLGAQIIISGAISKIGDLYRLRIRALSVESAEIEGQFNRNIPDGLTVTALVNSKATGYGDSAVTPASSAGAKTEPPAPAAAAAPAPVLPPVVPPPAPEPAPAEKVYQIGDKGPAGGIVFYDKGVFSADWRYLEAAPPETEFMAVWGTNSTVDGTASIIGSGKKNTQLITTFFQKSGKSGAGSQFTDLDINGYTDWFFPSQGELNLMYLNLKEKNLGRFSNKRYWSSTGNSNHAWYQDFTDGRQDTAWQHDSYSVRAIRQF